MTKKIQDKNTALTSEAAKTQKSGYRTLLLSVILSSPGPLILGLGLTVGHSTTQIADFTRRTSELLALIVSFVVYVITHKKGEEETEERELERKRLEKKSNFFVGVIMCISGLSMLILTFLAGNRDKGNVLPAFVIALSGVIANTLFWRKYASLYKKDQNAILGIQARLYGAKSVVDLCITLTLLLVLLAPASPMAFWFDILGSVLVSAYMIRCGIRTIRENLGS